jgi:magnesium-transporting ATPase (P-type)
MYSGSGGLQGAALRDFFSMLAVCHTVMVEREVSAEKGIANDDSDLKYAASSPDELALVMGAKDVGIIFHKRTA